MSIKRFMIWALPMLSLFLTITARATVIDFTGPYLPENWTATYAVPDGSAITSITPPAGASSTLSFGYNDDGDSGLWFNPAVAQFWFLTTSVHTGQVNFDWNWVGHHSWFQADGDMYFYSGGSLTHIRDVGSGGWNVGGSFSGLVTTGQQFGIYVTGDHSDSSALLHGTVTLSNFNVVPEPSTIALMGLCLAGLGFRRRRQA